MRQSFAATALLGAAILALPLLLGAAPPAPPAPAVQPQTQGAATPEEAAADAVQPGFAGRKQIGAWTLVCARMPGRPGVAPAPTEQNHATVTGKSGQKMVDVTIHVPPRPCHLAVTIKEADTPERRTLAKLALRGPYGVLVFNLRAPQELFPGKLVSPGLAHADRPAAPGSRQARPKASAENSGEEFIALDYDGSDLKGPLIVCGPNACIAGVKIPHEAEPGFVAAKHVAIVFPPFPGKAPARIDLPIDGMAQAIAAMRRMEK